MRVIGLDIGTTGICGVLIDCESGKVIKSASRNNRFLASEKDYEKLQSPDEIMEKLYAILAELGTEDVASIGVTGQMHGILYVNANGKALSPLYTWQDGRGRLPYKDGKTYADALSSHTGYGNVTNLFNRENDLIPKEATAFCTIHDYAVMQLTGRSESLLHISDAASLGCYDLIEKKFTIEDPLLPKVTQETVIAGQYRDIPVSIAIGDNQASFLGCGCRPGDLLINIGTGAQVSLITERTETDSELELRPLCEGQNIFVGSSLCGGRAYALLESFFRQVLLMSGGDDKSLYGAMERAAREKGTTDLCFETLFSGTRADPYRRATITSLSSENFTPGDFILSCLDGMLEELYSLYLQCGIKAARIVASGNGIRRNPLLREMIERKFGMALSMPVHLEEAAYGAALFSLAASGIRKNMQHAQEVIKYEL